MEEPFSSSAADRLPSAIKGLNKILQKTYICLRLRKSEQEISRQLSLSIDETRDKIKAVRNELIKAGQVDLIEDPKFVSIHAEDPDALEIPLAADGLDIDTRLIVKEFLSCLKQSINELPKHQLQILKLRYKYQLSAKDILGFSKKLGYRLIPEKELSDLKEQDIFYALNTVLREVFIKLEGRHSESDLISIDGLKYIFEEIGI